MPNRVVRRKPKPKGYLSVVAGHHLHKKTPQTTAAPVVETTAIIHRLPVCWLGKSRTVIEKGIMVGVNTTYDDVNRSCTCWHEKDAFFCEHSKPYGMLACDRTIVDDDRTIKPETKGGDAHGKGRRRGKHSEKNRSSTYQP